MRVRELPRKAARMLRPWPGQRDRKAAISAARREKEHSQARAEHAAGIEQQIWHLTRDNHFAETIADQIIATYRKRGGH